ncbi:Formyltransferase/hydrolase complex subunit D [Methylobacterium cerastii]|uniref:Formylmethanofuran--tetrahydromethanopterin formyltransferase n=1 Tax=Methylobacterium cerastii TaxID=932741 RepID=A0ABQ4QEP9_9HYPH|nr:MULTISPECIES: formylmethanofuran--tetrahydromethanopterin N-formyltransferase [Methylobacterium]TXN00220.1 formylmethanofuran--tetrahydromethanopterin N-formyltransferase [Methylobacterium sp. WL122]TXM69360.1 formylmethanofuran--tetrahydromethanopterin N-formyltransferase [Methylobacterium sp. WL120]TXM71628.1 formylmethanofuran--tetrahydromethanopterin N-formyltransferase [Methylobacterium sp. WL12]TXM96684.1 formylmethanofuran--tetrahydromethanopterin N-formyltransferase [Methylobacterium
MSDLTLNGIRVEDTFAEAFDVAGTAIVVTNDTAKWAMIAATTMTGFATSVIGCGAEAGIDAELSPEETPDGRPGVRILLFGFEPNGLKEQLLKRVGQCILTCPGTACFAGVEGPTKIKLGGAIRYFGDGFAIAKRLPDHTGKMRRYWRIPVMDGEFLCEDSVRAVDGAVGGGNLLFLGRNHAETLKVAEVAVEAAKAIPGAILPFPGGIVRSGSKVGARTKGMMASTNDAYCPTLKGRAGSALPAECGVVLEIVIDALTSQGVSDSMRAALHAATEVGAQHGLVAITAGNYGGNLGRHHYRLRDLLEKNPAVKETEA